jgi:hypothetical protein
LSIVETISAAVKPWHDWYSHSKATSSTVTWVHLSALVIGGGLAIASDRVALRLRNAGVDDRRRMLDEFSAVHRPIVIALGVSVLSGLAMLFSDVDTYFVSPVYWTKMGLVILLLANGYGVMRTEQRLHEDPSPGNRLWGRLRLGAVASITLWLGTTLAGVVLTSS